MLQSCFLRFVMDSMFVPGRSLVHVQANIIDLLSAACFSAKHAVDNNKSKESRKCLR